MVLNGETHLVSTIDDNQNFKKGLHKHGVTSLLMIRMTITREINKFYIFNFRFSNHTANSMYRSNVYTQQ